MEDIEHHVARRRRQIPTAIFALVIILSFYVAILFAALSVLLLSGHTWIS